MTTNKDVQIKFRDYGVITVPKGTKLTHQTALGIDKNYHFVAEFEWIDRDYPTVNRLMRHDATYYGIDIPKEYVDYND